MMILQARLADVIDSSALQEGDTVIDLTAEGDFQVGEACEDIDIVSSAQDADTAKFDLTVGALSDILLEPGFEDARQRFCEQNCSHFEEGEENKLIYTQLFQQYTQLLESTIECRLKQAVPGFDMQWFVRALHTKQDELMSDVFELMASFGDFEAFKELMLAYKRERTSGLGLQIQCRPIHIHREEQEDGEARPDLDMAINVRGIGGSTRP